MEKIKTASFISNTNIENENKESIRPFNTRRLEYRGQ